MDNQVLTGFTIDTYKGITPSFLLQQVRRIGIEFAEVTVTIFDDIEKIIRAVDSLKIGLHLPIIPQEGFDFSCVEKQNEIDAIIKQINKYWRKLGLLYVLSHPTEKHLFETEYRVSEEFLFDNLKKIDAPVLLENTMENSSLRFDDFLARAKKELRDQLTGICFDAPHAYISRDNWLEMLEEYFEEVRLIHLSDCTKEKDLHMPFSGEGNLPIKKIMDYLQAKDYRGIVNLELLPKSLKDLGAVFDSYLFILRYLNRKKYNAMRIRRLFILPLLKKRLQ